MQKADLLYLWDYNHWANERVLRAAEQVTPAQFIAPANLSHGSLRGALVHLVGVEQVWRLRCQEGASPAILSEGDVPTLARLIAIWSVETQAMQTFLAQLPAGDVQQTITYTTTTGATYTNLLWQLLAHTINHSTQFRSEASMALTAYHHSPGDLDMLIFLRERQ